MPAQGGAPLGDAGLSWTPIRTADGSPTLVHPVHGEACHSRAGAWQEARERYAVACGLAEFRGAEFRLLDIGTGLGLNIAAALEALAPTKASLRVVTLEKDASVLRATLGLAFPAEVDRWHAPVRAAMTSALDGAQEAALAGGTLRLLLGDARDNLPRLPRDLAFDAVFLDPFSPRVEPDLWQLAFLREIARRMAPGSRLSTYSASMSVRAGLLAAGLRVGAGARVGTKSSGTLASPDEVPGAFDARTQRRLAKRARDLADAPKLEPAGDSSPGERLRADP